MEKEQKLENKSIEEVKQKKEKVKKEKIKKEKVKKEKIQKKKTPKKPKLSLFRQLHETFTPEEQEKIDRHFYDFKIHCHMAKKESELLLEDVEKALLYYRHVGVSLDEALSRLNNEKLGGFYATPASLWFPLDDAAKIYPFSMQEGYMNIYRLAMNLKEDVVPELLQMALNFTIKRFPVFATTLKKGLFWHYLDSTKRRFTVHEATSIPCSPIPISQSGAQAFRVIYYKNRISVEFFHILTDGTGAVAFLRALVAEYLRLLGYEAEEDETLIDISDTPTKEEITNEFSQVEKPENSTGFADKPALQMSGNHSSTLPCRIIHLKLNVNDVKAAAKKHNTTITTYLLAIMFIASKAATESMSGDVSIQVPVNMRQYYPSKTLRNFSMYAGIRITVEEITSINDIIPEILSQIAEKTSKEAMSAMVAGTNRLVKGIRFIPMVIKTPVAKMVYGLVGERIFTTTISNLGVVTMPKGFAEHIKDMELSLGASKTNKALCGVVTYGDTVTLTITKNTVSPVFEEKMYSLLKREGIDPTVEGSPLYEY